MNINKAVVAAPPVRDFYFTPGRASALGAISVQEQLKWLGIESEVYNFPLSNPRGTSIPLPSFYDYLQPHLISGERGPLTFFTKRKLYGPSFEKAAETLLERSPQIVFISLFAWTYGDDAIKLAREVRKQSEKEILIILGGAGAAVLSEYFINSRLFDVVLTGEAETAIPPLIKHIRAGLPLDDFKESKNLIETPSPLLSFHKDSKGGQWLTTILSRGCPKKCRFCSNFLTQGRRFRMVDLKQLENRLNSLPINREQPVHINLEDDNLLFRKEYFERFLNLMAKKFPRRSFTMDNGLDYTFLNEEYADFLINQGFSHFSLSLGSAEEFILEREKRPADLEKLERLLTHLKKRKIPSTTFFIAGLPDDTPEGVVNTLLYLHKLPTQSGISPFYPVPGLPRFEEKELFLNNSPQLCSGSSVYPWADSLTTAQMVTAFRLSRLSNLLKKENKEQKEIELIERIKSTGRIHTLKGKNREIIPLENLDKKMCAAFLSQALH